MKGPCKLEQLLPAPLKKQAVAVGAALVLAAGSVFGIGGAKLAAYESRTAASFSQGQYSIAADLSARENSAANLVTVAEKTAGLDAALADAVRAAIEAAQAAQGPAEKARADTALADAVNALYDAASRLADQNQYDLLAGELAEFNSRGNTIRNNDYNSNAQAFNKALEGPLARLIGALWGVKEAEYFE